MLAAENNKMSEVCKHHDRINEAELLDNKKIFKIGKLSVASAKLENTENTKTKIYQVKPTGNVTMKNIIGEIKDIIS